MMSKFQGRNKQRQKSQFSRGGDSAQIRDSLAITQNLPFRSSGSPPGSTQKEINRFSRLRQVLSRAKSKNLEQEKTKQYLYRFRAYSKFKQYQKMAYLVLEHPESSKLGKAIWISKILGILICISEAIFMSTDRLLKPPTPLLVFDLIILFVFMFELMLRVFSVSAFTDNVLKALFQPLILIDIITILPNVLEITPSTDPFFMFARDYRLAGLLKTLNILKLLRYVKNIEILLNGVRQSVASFAFLILLIIIATFTCATSVYYLEKSNPNSPMSDGIPTALWWTIVTMTTVGYGDVIPVTAGGKIIGGIVALFGMILLALPVVILGYHFQEVYNDREEQITIERVKSNELKNKADLDEDQRETYFLKKRIKSIETSNNEIMNQLGNSGGVYKNVSRDLRVLYQSIYAEGKNKDQQEPEVRGFGQTIRRIEKMSAARRKIKLINLFNKGLHRKTSRSSGYRTPKSAFSPKKTVFVKSDFETLPSMEAKPTEQSFSFAITEFMKTQHLATLNNETEDIQFETNECVSTMQNLVSKPSTLSHQRSMAMTENTGPTVTEAPTRNQFPQIIVNHPSTTSNSINIDETPKRAFDGPESSASLQKSMTPSLKGSPDVLRNRKSPFFLKSHSNPPGIQEESPMYLLEAQSFQSNKSPLQLSPLPNNPFQNKHNLSSGLSSYLDSISPIKFDVDSGSLPRTANFDTLTPQEKDLLMLKTPNSTERKHNYFSFADEKIMGKDNVP